MIVEFNDWDAPVFEKIMRTLEYNTSFEKHRLSNEPVISLPGLEIYPDRKKIYRDRREICLTAKEYDILTYLVLNRGRVLTYDQIFQQVWGKEGFGGENNTVGCHVRNLRKKLYKAEPDAPFKIRCVREIGYCFEVNSEATDNTF